MISVSRVSCGINARISGGPLLSSQGTADGVVFAAAVGESDAGFALTAAENPGLAGALGPARSSGRPGLAAKGARLAARLIVQ